MCPGQPPSPLAWSNDHGELVSLTSQSAAAVVGRGQRSRAGISSTQGEMAFDTYTAETDDALIFTGSKGAALRRSNFHRSSNWAVVTIEVGLAGFHFHDLRHTGNVLAAGSGASLADLMARMGHGSTRAAMIYQHATRQADQAIASALDEQIRKGQDRARNGHGRGRRGAGMSKGPG